MKSRISFRFSEKNAAQSIKKIKPTIPDLENVRDIATHIGIKIAINIILDFIKSRNSSGTKSIISINATELDSYVKRLKRFVSSPAKVSVSLPSIMPNSGYNNLITITTIGRIKIKYI